VIVTGDKVPLGTLTTPSTAITSEVVFEFAYGSVTLRFEYDKDGLSYRGGVEFGRVRAYRFRAEGHCSAWHIEGTYDTIVEIEDSDWIKELRAEVADGQDIFEMHHYMLFLDGSGCFEVIGGSWSLFPEIRVT
jgi:hypothetical protein